MEGTTTTSAPIVTPVASAPVPVAPSKGFSIGKFHWKNKYFLYAGGAIAGTYVAMYLYKQSQLMYDTCFKPAGFIPNSLGLTNADINIKLMMKNKSKIDYYLKNQVYNVYISDQFVGAIKNPNKLYIAPEKSSPVWLNVKFNPMQVANISWDTLKGLLTNGGDVKIQIKGNARVVDKNGFFGFNYPVDETFTLKDLTSGAVSTC